MLSSSTSTILQEQWNKHYEKSTTCCYHKGGVVSVVLARVGGVGPLLGMPMLYPAALTTAV